MGSNLKEMRCTAIMATEQHYQTFYIRSDIILIFISKVNSLKQYRYFVFAFVFAYKLMYFDDKKYRLVLFYGSDWNSRLLVFSEQQ